MTSKPVVLVFLLLILVITSQFEWKQQLSSESEAISSASEKIQQLVLNKEFVKEKIILSQEKNIQRLNELVRSLQQQLLHCQGSNNTGHSTENSLTADVIGIERQLVLEGLH